MNTRVRRNEAAAADLFGVEAEQRAFQQRAREYAAAPQTAGVAVTMPAWLITVIFAC